MGVPVCPHAGGVGLCNMVPHLQAWDYVSLTGTTQHRLVEWVDHLHQHFQEPPRVERARYVIPDSPGYSTKFKVREDEEGEEPRNSHVCCSGGVRGRLFVSWRASLESIIY